MELAAAADFYDERNPQLGNEFLEEVGRSIAFIKDFPKAASLVHHSAGHHRIERFPYGVVHIVCDADIVVIAVAQVIVSAV